MYYIPRGGTRGGADQFTWDSVKTDKDREYYLGHSLKAPVGRWQDGKDLQWFNKDRKDGEMSMSDERQVVKQAEREAMMAALGQKVVKTSPQAASSTQYVQPRAQTSRTGIERLSKKQAKRSHNEKKKKKQKKEKSKKAKKTKSKKKKRHQDTSSDSSSESSSSSDSSSESYSSSSTDSEEERIPQRRKHRHRSPDAEDHHRVKSQRVHSDSRRTKPEKSTASYGRHSRQSEMDSKYKQRDFDKRKRTHSDSVERSTMHPHRPSDKYHDKHRERSRSTSPPPKRSSVPHRDNTYYKRKEKYPIGHREERSSKHR